MRESQQGRREAPGSTLLAGFAGVLRELRPVLARLDRRQSLGVLTASFLVLLTLAYFLFGKGSPGLCFAAFLIAGGLVAHSGRSG